MSPLVVLVVVVLLLGGDASATPKKPEPHDDHELEDEDPKCPAGSPLIYTGPEFNTNLEDFQTEEADLTLSERQNLVATLAAVTSDLGFPAPVSGVCLQEDLSAWLKIGTANTPSATWPSILAMLAYHMAWDAHGPWKFWTDLSPQQQTRVKRYAKAIELRQADDDESEQDPDAYLPTSSPTKGRWYVVRSGDTVLGMAGAASGFAAGTKQRREYAKAVSTAPQNAATTTAASPGSFDAKYMGGRTMRLVAKYSCTVPGAIYGSGDCYPAVYFP